MVERGFNEQPSSIETPDQLTGRLLEVARAQIGRSRFELGIDPGEAPQVVDCSSFAQWAFAQVGADIPRRTVWQREAGSPIEPEDVRAGDLVFRTGNGHNYTSPEGELVGHVGIASGPETVIHATNGGVREGSLAEFVIEPSRYRGARRVL